jgi:hypothetical protein
MEALGLTVLEGGRHPGRGTANLIVPLPFATQYLELLAVIDEAEALSSPQGRPVAATLARRGPGLARWGVEVGDIEATAARVGLPVEQRQRVLGDGRVVRWRAVGVDAAWDEPWRCAFLAWDDPGLHPGRAGGVVGRAGSVTGRVAGRVAGRVVHRNGATGFARLEVDVPDHQSLAHWVGGPVPEGVAVSVGTGMGPTGLFLRCPAGELSIS